MVILVKYNTFSVFDFIIMIINSNRYLPYINYALDIEKSLDPVLWAVVEAASTRVPIIVGSRFKAQALSSGITTNPFNGSSRGREKNAVKQCILKVLLFM